MQKYSKLLIIFWALTFSIETLAKKRPLVVFVCGDHEYGGELTLPLLAKELQSNYGFETKVLTAYPNQNAEENIPGLEILEKADLAIFFLRWRRLSKDQLQYIDDYLKSGKPVMGFRTSTHAFNFPKGHESEKWNAFGETAFNAPPGWGGKAGHTHYGHESTTSVSIIPSVANHPILKGINSNFNAKSWLYRVQPDFPSRNSEWLLLGKALNPDKAAIDNPVAWTGRNMYNGKVFFTTLGHPEDFQIESFQRMLINAIYWELGKKVPKKWKGKIDINIPYRGIVK